MRADVPGARYVDVPRVGGPAVTALAGWSTLIIRCGNRGTFMLR